MRSALLSPLFYRVNEALRGNLLKSLSLEQPELGLKPRQWDPRAHPFWALPCTLATPQAFFWLPFFLPLHQALQIRYISFCLDHLEGLCFFRETLNVSMCHSSYHMDVSLNILSIAKCLLSQRHSIEMETSTAERQIQVSHLTHSRTSSFSRIRC